MPAGRFNCFFAVFLLFSHADLRREFGNLAIRLALVLIVFDDADDLQRQEQRTQHDLKVI